MGACTNHKKEIQQFKNHKVVTRKPHEKMQQSHQANSYHPAISVQKWEKENKKLGSPTKGSTSVSAGDINTPDLLKRETLQTNDQT